MDLNKFKLYELYELKRLLVTGELLSSLDNTIKLKQQELEDSYNNYFENLYNEVQEEVYSPIIKDYEKDQEHLLDKVLNENRKGKVK